MNPKTLATIATTALITLLTLTASTTTAGQPEGVCDQLTTGHLGDGGSTVTFTAPDGYLIVTYCVKAGSILQGDGPEYTNVNPAEETVTISHSSGKDISHYSVLYKPEVPPSTTTTTTTTTTLPQCPLPPCVPDTQGNTTTTSEAATSTTPSTSSPTSTSSPSVEPTTTTSPSSSVPTTTLLPPSSSTQPATSSTTSTTTTTTTTLPDTFTFGAAATVCRAEVPTIVIQFQNQFPSLAGQTGTLTMSDVNGNIVSTQPLVYQPGTTVELLYPGTAINADGTIDDVPGWILQDNGLWVRDPSDEFLREGIQLTYTVNPTATATVEYPPESSACANPENPPIPPAPPGSLPPTA